jgi:hypothetical protein
MAERIAIKRLTSSDCTLFEAVFRKIGAGNQKSINLNAEILTGQLYPGLTGATASNGNEIPLPLSIYGPGGKGAHRLTRKIIKNATYKNWRLNGEFIHGPPDDGSRYDDINPGDLAVMAFEGEQTPAAMDLILVAQNAPDDAPLHKALTPLLANKSMVAVDPTQIAAAAESAGIPSTHPIYLAADDPEMDAALEDAAQGGVAGLGKLLTNRASRRVSLTDLVKAKARADQTGRDGEGLVNGYLVAELKAGRLGYINWVSDQNAIAPFDFEIGSSTGERTLIDVKSTTGPFENIIHVSLAEVLEASGAIPYRIYRVFELNEDGGKLRRSEDIGTLARTLKALHEQHMPAGIRIDGFSVSTSILKWSVEELVDRQDGSDEP